MILGAAGSTYVGPGDVKASAQFWGGLRAYNAVTAAALSAAVQVRRASDNTTQDVKVLSTGALDTASALTFAGTDATGTGSITGTTLTFTGGHTGDTVTGGTVAAGTYIVSGASPTWTVNISQTVASATLTLTWGLFVSILYDQTASTTFGDAKQTTNSQQPALMLNGGGTSGTLPYMRFNGAQFLLANTGTFGVTAQPLTMSWVGIRTGAFTTYGFVIGTGAGTKAHSGFDTTANTLVQYAGTFVTIGSNPDNTWYAVQAAFNGASSTNYANGTSTSTSPGALASPTPLVVGATVSTAIPMTGSVAEAGLWASAFSGGDNSAMNSNQRTYWGF